MIAYSLWSKYESFEYNVSLIMVSVTDFESQRFPIISSNNDVVRSFSSADTSILLSAASFSFCMLIGWLIMVWAAVFPDVWQVTCVDCVFICFDWDESLLARNRYSAF